MEPMKGFVYGNLVGGAVVLVMSAVLLDGYMAMLGGIILMLSAACTVVLWARDRA